jgi:hypothetical protein
MKNVLIGSLVFIVVVTAIACTKGFDTSSTGSIAVASVGSTARFAISKNRLYALGKADIGIVDIADPQNLSIVTRQNLREGLETIYPFGDALFIGTTTGVYGYNISNPNLLSAPSFISHLTACDPVVADSKNIYLTLRAGTRCNNNINLLQHYTYTMQGSNAVQMKYVTQVNMNSPRGLALNGQNLFVCDIPSGIKVFNFTATGSPNYVKTQPLDGYECYDMIPVGNKLIVQHDKGLSFCDVTDPVNNFMVLKTIE